MRILLDTGRSGGRRTSASPATLFTWALAGVLGLSALGVSPPLHIDPGLTAEPQWSSFRSVARGNQVSSVSLAVEGQSRFVAYTVFRSFGRRLMLAEFTASDEQGHAAVVNSSYATSSDTAIAVREGRVCIAWLRYKPLDGTSDALLSCRAKGSRKWTESEPLVTGYYSSGSLDLEAGPGGWVFAVSFNGHVHVSTSFDGVTWGEPVSVTTDDENAWASSIALQGRRVFLLYNLAVRLGRMALRVSTDFGNTWSELRTVATDLQANLPRAAASSDRLAVTWFEGRSDALIGRSYDIASGTFDAPEEIAGQDDVTILPATVAASPNGPTVIVWGARGHAAVGGILFASYLGGDGIWSRPVAITVKGERALWPTVVFGRGAFHLVYISDRHEIRYRRQPL